MSHLLLARAGERRLLAALRQDVNLRVPSLCPEWTRAQVVAHLIGNAALLGDLLRAARTGVVAPRCPTRAARMEQIDRDARRPDEWLLDEVRRSSDELMVAMTELRPQDWGSVVRSTPNRTLTAADVPWLRCRESFVHLVDLDVGVGFADLPAEFVTELLDRATTTVSRRAGCPAVWLVAGSRQWTLGAEPYEHEVSGTEAELAAWVTGRARVSGWPALPPWL